MKVVETIWHVWAMRALTDAGGSGAALDTLATTQKDIEEQTTDQIEAVGLEWVVGGLHSISGRPLPAEVYDRTVMLDMAVQQIEALNEAYYGSQISPPYAWPQTLMVEAKRAARTLGPVLQDLLQQAISWQQFERMPPGVKDQVKAALLKEGDDGP